jgi:hypothetical protein
MIRLDKRKKKISAPEEAAPEVPFIAGAATGGRCFPACSL